MLLSLCFLHLNAQSKVLAAKKEISETAIILNKKLPAKIDELTTLIIINYDNEKNELAYFFKVTDYYNSEMYKQGVDKFIENAKSSAINFIRNHPYNKSYIIAQLDFVYIYLDSNNKLIYKFRITPNDYNN